MGRNWTLVKTMILAAMVVFGTVIGCSDDDSPAGPGDGTGGGGGVTMPASWGGTWIVSEGALPPARQDGLEVTVDAFCAGITAEELILDEDEGTCTGTWTDTNASLTCVATETVGDCIATFRVVLELTRNDDAFTGTVTESVTYSAACEEEDEEGGFSISATRTNTDQIGCDDLPQGLPASWGGTWQVTEGRQGGELLCPGDTVEEIIFSDAPGDVDVLGGFTETRLEAFATSDVTNGTPGCTVIQTTTIEITRDGNSLSGTGVERTYTLQTPGQATCADAGDVDVQNFTLSGTRTSTDVSACSGGGGGRGRTPVGTRGDLEHRVRDPG